MRLSIVVPIYNAEKYLNECIKSILCQTFCDFELILVNDGSQDRSLDICRLWEKKDSRIRIIDKENGGVSSARNAGVEVSKGEYIGFVDSDDFIDRQMYEKLFKAVKEVNADIGICKRIIPQKKQNYGHNYPKGTSFRFSDGKKIWKEFFYQGDIETFVTNKVFKAAFIKENLLKFLAYPLFEDRLYLLQLYLNNPVMVYLDEPLYFYRPVQDSGVHRYCPERFEIIKKIYHYTLELNTTFDSGYYINLINKSLAESIVNCIIQEKRQTKKNQIAMFSKIRESEEFQIIYSKIDIIGLKPKKEKMLRLLYQKKYNVLCYQLEFMWLYDRIKTLIKNILGRMK